MEEEPLYYIQGIADKLKPIAKKNILEYNDWISEGEFEVAWFQLFNSLSAWKYMMDGYIIPNTHIWLSETNNDLPNLLPGVEWGELSPEEVAKVRKGIKLYLNLYKLIFTQ